MSRARAYLNIKTQFSNVGDALIVRELIGLIARHADVLVVLNRCPPGFVRTLGLDGSGPVAVERLGGAWKMIRSVVSDRVKGRDVFYFLMPGGINGEKSTKAFLLGIVANVYLTFLWMLGVRLCQVGISYENIGPKYRMLLRWRSRLLHRHMVRDRISFDYAASMGLKLDGILPDLAFNIFDKGEAAAPNSGSTTAFSFRVDKSPAGRARLEAITLEICRRLDAGSSVLFVVQVQRDLDVMQALLKRAEDLGHLNCRLLVSYDDIEKCREAYKDCKTIFSNRLHALMLGMSSGAVPIALVDRKHDVKIIGLFESIGLKDQIRVVAEEPFDYTMDGKLSPVSQIEAARIESFFEELLARPDGREGVEVRSGYA